MKFSVPMLCCALSVGVCSAEDFTLMDGRVLHDAVVLRQGTDEVQVRHTGGIQLVRYDLLPSELQQRFEMTPEQVEKRREEARLEAHARKQQKREAEEQHRARLEAAGQQARYLQGADVLKLISPREKMDSRLADYLACEWNRREAERLGLQSEMLQFAENGVGLKAACADVLKKESLARRELEKERTQSKELRQQLEEAKAEITRLQDANYTLRNENSTLLKVATTKQTETVVVKPQPIFIKPAPPRPIKVRPK